MTPPWVNDRHPLVGVGGRDAAEAGPHAGR